MSPGADDDQVLSRDKFELRVHYIGTKKLAGTRASNAASSPAHRRARRGSGAILCAADARRARSPEAAACYQKCARFYSCVKT